MSLLPSTTPHATPNSIPGVQSLYTPFCNVIAEWVMRHKSENVGGNRSGLRCDSYHVAT
jgi:hypothetical protein